MVLSGIPSSRPEGMPPPSRGPGFEIRTMVATMLLRGNCYRTAVLAALRAVLQDGDSCPSLVRPAVPSVERWATSESFTITLRRSTRITPGSSLLARSLIRPEQQRQSQTEHDE